MCRYRKVSGDTCSGGQELQYAPQEFACPIPGEIIHLTIFLTCLKLELFQDPHLFLIIITLFLYWFSFPDYFSVSIGIPPFMSWTGSENLLFYCTNSGIFLFFIFYFTVYWTLDEYVLLLNMLSVFWVKLILLFWIATRCAYMCLSQNQSAHVNCTLILFCNLLLYACICGNLQVYICRKVKKRVYCISK